MKHVLILLLALCTAAPLRADDLAKRKDLAADLLEAMNARRYIEQGFDNARRMLVAQLRAMGVKQSGIDQAQSVNDQAMALLEKEFSWERLKDEYIAVYANAFSADELRELLAFYKSPIGRKYVERQPEIAKQSGEITRQRMLKVGPQVQEIARQAAGAAVPAVLPPPPGKPAGGKDDGS